LQRLKIYRPRPCGQESTLTQSFNIASELTAANVVVVTQKGWMQYVVISNQTEIIQPKRAKTQHRYGTEMSCLTNPECSVGLGTEFSREAEAHAVGTRPA